MIQAMHLTREDVYICNVIKCRRRATATLSPTRWPLASLPQEANCRVQPRVIVALGKFAAHLLTGEHTPITRLRGNIKHYQGIPVMPTYHPAFLLRDESRKGEAWHDLKRSWRC